MKNPLVLSWRYLRVKWKRTLLTAFGILMAVALVAATGLLVVSIQNMFLRDAIQDSGSWHYMIPQGLTKDQAETLAANVHFEKSALFTSDTYARFGLKDISDDGEDADPSNDNDYEYVSINGLTEEAGPMLPYQGKLTEGRMPQNGNEVALPTGALTHLPSGTALGSQITWEVGGLTRTTVEVKDTGLDDNGQEVEFTREQELMEFHPTGERTYTLVGVYDETYPANRAITMGLDAGQTYGLYVQVKPILHFSEAMDQALQDAGIQAEYRPNAGVLRYWGQMFEQETFASFMWVFIILAIIILAAMMMVIRNSFAISIGEKITQFGVLRCVGATRKQIRHVVLSEGILMWLMAVPLGLAAAILAMVALAAVVRNVAPDLMGEFYLKMAVWPFAAALAMSFVAVMFSAWAPAVRTGRISPIEAVRGNTQMQSENIKRNRKGNVMGRIFGFSGLLAVKNMRRNTKRYRATLLSIVVSIALFLTLSGFSFTLKDSNNRYGNTDLYDFSVWSGQIGRVETGMADKLLSELPSVKALPGVERAGFVQNLNMILTIPQARVQQDCIEAAEHYGAIDYLGTVQPSGDWQVGLSYLGMDRGAYETLKFKGSAPSYDELVASGGAILCQTVTMNSSTRGLEVVDFTDYKPGETLLAQISGDDGGSTDEQVKIEGLLAETPWMRSFRMGLYLVVPNETFQKLTGSLQGENAVYIQSNIAIKAKNGQQTALSEALKQANASTGFLAGFELEDLYKQTRSTQNLILVLDIFIYGFVTVVVMICSLNVFNTIGTNLQARRRELSMLRALGMQKRQLWRMQIVECLLYGLKGTFWGALLGFPLQWLLMKAVDNAMSVQFVMGRSVVMVVYSLVVSVAIAMLAGYGPIRALVRESVVEGIRAQD